MTEQDQDFDPADGEDLQLELALLEYAKSMEEPARTIFLQRLKDDQSYYLGMGKSLSEMAMLIAGAAVIDDDAEFVKMRRRILFESRGDDAELRSLRIYYLNNRHAVDMEQVLDGEEARQRFEARLTEFHEDYRQQHPA
jgi:hypothetical protein